MLLHHVPNLKGRKTLIKGIAIFFIFFLIEMEKGLDSSLKKLLA